MVSLHNEIVDVAVEVIQIGNYIFIPRNNVAPNYFIINDVLKKSHVPSRVMKTVFSISASATEICQHLVLTTILEKYLFFRNRSN